MKHCLLIAALSYFAPIGPVSCQENIQTDTVPKGGKSEILIFGRKHDPGRKIPPHKSSLILKTDLVTFGLRGFALEVERPADTRNSFVFRSGWQKMNHDLPFRKPGTYYQKYEIGYKEVTTFDGRPVSSSKSYSQNPFPETDAFVPTAMIPLQASIRSYLGKKSRQSRFFLQPGIRLMYFKGMHTDVNQTLLGTTTINYEEHTSNNPYGFGTTDYIEIQTYSYQQICTAKAAPGRVAGCLSLDFGWRFQGKGRMSAEFGVRSGWNAAKNIYGLQKMYFLPMVNVAVGI